MKRHATWVLIASAAVVLSACSLAKRETLMKSATAPATVKLTDAEWRAKLTPEQYRVCRQGGTEASGSGALLNETREGTYRCAACSAPLFESKTKYDACGWPSFWDALPGAVSTRPDGGALEALCARCGSHLGHLFDDGPPPTGKRY